MQPKTAEESWHRSCPKPFAAEATDLEHKDRKESAMTRRVFTTLLITAAAALTVAADAAGESRMERSQHGYARRAIADHTTAVAALEPVGSAEGWGRVMVKDMALSDDGLRRLAAIHLLGLEPEAVYRVIVDGVVLAELDTDAIGDAQLRLDPDDETAPQVPEELPLADELLNAVVEDASGAAVLQGDFVSRSYGFAGPNDLVHYERIELVPIDDYARRGIARVSRDGEDVQRFETRACGLEAGEMYEILIDGTAAGQVTAGPVGQAALELSTVDVDNPLPTDTLGPIEDYRLVEWVWLSSSLGDTIVLTGSFTGDNRVGGGQARSGDPAGGGDNGRNGDGQGDCTGSGGSGQCDGSGTGVGTGGENDNGQNGHQGDGSGDGDQNSHGGDADDDDVNGHYGDGECDGSGSGGECDGTGSGNRP
jgi:hypothetical protein